MTGHPRLWNRDGRWYFRCKVPLDLIEQLGKRLVREALDTSDRRVALEKVRIASATWDARFAEERRKLDARRRFMGANGNAPEVPKLDDRSILQMVLLWFHRCEVERERGAALVSVVASPADDGSSSPEHDLAVLEDADDPNCRAAVTRVVRDLLTTNRLELPAPGSSAYDELVCRSDYQMLWGMVHRGMVESARRAVAQIRGAAAVRAFDMLFRGTNAATAPPDVAGGARAPDITLGELIDAYMQAPELRDRSTKTETGYNVIFRLLRELLGSDTKVRTITRPQCRELRDALLKLPPNASKRFPKLGVREVIELATEKGLPPISVGTVNSYLTNLSSLFNWAVTERYMAENPAKGLAVADTKQDKERRNIFTLDDLKAIFGSDLYTREGASNSPGKFWLPLIALYSGMRANEIGQLRIADVVQIEGVWCFRVTAEGGDDKRLKTASSRRVVPLHPELVRLGLLVYHRTASRTKGGRLFPDLSISAQGYYSDNISKWFGRYLVACGIKTPTTSFHSFRHCFRDALREAGVSRDLVRALGGWKDRATEEIYGDGYKPQTLLAAITKVHYAGLALKRVERVARGAWKVPPPIA